MEKHAVGDTLERVERQFFVGRMEELDRFDLFMKEKDRPKFIFNVYGTGGVGKSYLLRELRRCAQTAGHRVCWLDTQAIQHTPEAFMTSIMEAIQLQVGNTSAAADMHAAIPSLQACFGVVNKLAEKQRMILFLDEYECIHGLDTWLRDTFFRGLHRNVQVVIAGRAPLDGSWVSSPAWRQCLVQIPLRNFNKLEALNYLEKHGIGDTSDIERVWMATDGHPLYVSLMIPLLYSQTPFQWPVANLISELVDRWFKETVGAEIRSLLEYGSIPRSFNQELLGVLRGSTISDDEFAAITRISFVKANVRGWAMQAQVREAIHCQFKRNKPNEYRLSLARCANYWVNLLQKGAGPLQAAAATRDFIGCVANSMVRSVLPYTDERSDNRLETMDRHNFAEVERYVEKRRLNAKMKQAHYPDVQNEHTYSLHLPAQQDEKRAELVRPEDWLAMGLDSIKLLKNRSGSMIGLAAAIPINRLTLTYMAEQPVSRSYFNALSESEKMALAVPGHTQAGWFLRVLDVEQADDSAARSELMDHFLGYLQYGNLLLTSTSLPFYQKLLLGLGFREVEAAVHYDYGEDTPALTYMLDLREEHFQSYLLGMAKMAGISIAASEFVLTDREREIARYIIEGLTNKEISQRLYVSEITVKKHVSHIYEKVGVNRRGQLIKLLMEQAAF
ncbi:LuxR C-terminal-related transcriptional regulator [Paenibacillus sp. FSL H8-0034]|uniref:LuxR C-terminal-related transcriptional regulator n=1 Tax=Paenibacillus sp. FSL H8-0034 TaxID=2954671 RepID=UPI0030F6A9DB